MQSDYGCKNLKAYSAQGKPAPASISSRRISSREKKMPQEIFSAKETAQSVLDGREVFARRWRKGEEKFRKNALRTVTLTRCPRCNPACVSSASPGCSSWTVTYTNSSRGGIRLSSGARGNRGNIFFAGGSRTPHGTRKVADISVGL